MTEPTKYALVTGGSRGIGREICLMLARSGYYVLINYRSNADEAQRTLEGVPVSYTHLTLPTIA